MDSEQLNRSVADLLPLFFFFNHTPPTDIYTLSLHDALPIWPSSGRQISANLEFVACQLFHATAVDRKSTRLNSSHLGISYAVFCLKKKKTEKRAADVPTVSPVVAYQSCGGKRSCQVLLQNCH